MVAGEFNDVDTGAGDDVDHVWLRADIAVVGRSGEGGLVAGVGEVKMAEIFADVGGEIVSVSDLVEFAIHAAGKGGDAGLSESEDLVASRECLDFGFESGFDFFDVFSVTVEDVIFKEGTGIERVEIVIIVNGKEALLAS